MPVNAIAMPFSFAAAIDSSSLIDPPRLETGVRLAICDSLSLATVVSLNDLGTAAPESQNRKPDPGLVFPAAMETSAVSPSNRQSNVAFEHRCLQLRALSALPQCSSV